MTYSTRTRGDAVVVWRSFAVRVRSLITASASLSCGFALTFGTQLSPAHAMSQDSAIPAQPLQRSPIVEILQSNGHWLTGSLRALTEAHCDLIKVGAADAAITSIPRADIIALIVAQGTDAILSEATRSNQHAATLLTPTVQLDGAQLQGSKRSLSMSTPLSLGILNSLDAQRLPGTFRVVNGRPTWEHRWIGGIGIDTNRLAALRLIADRPVTRKFESDALLLINGDVITGFIESLGDDVVLSPLEAQGTPAPAAANEDSRPHPSDDASEAKADEGKRRIPMERIATIGFADVPSERRLGSDVWTIDGSLVGARDIRFDQLTGWSFLLASEWLASVRPSSTADNLSADACAVVFQRQNFLPLAQCKVLSPTVPAGVFRYSTHDAVRVADESQFLLGCADVHIDGPIATSFVVPNEFLAQPGNALFCGDLVLARPAPLDARVAVTISAFGEPTFQCVLDTKQKRASFAIPVASTKLGMITIQLDDCGNGTVGDRIIIERAAIVLSPNN